MSCATIVYCHVVECFFEIKEFLVKSVCFRLPIEVVNTINSTARARGITVSQLARERLALTAGEQESGDDRVTLQVLVERIDALSQKIDDLGVEE